MDSIVNEAIDSMAFPGAQILISKKGEILFEKQCGFHTYDKKRPVRQDDLYDLASVTKVTTGLPILMKLHGEGRLSLDAPVEQYIPLFKRTDKSKLTFLEILAHQSGLIPYIVYWRNTIKRNGKFKKKTFTSKYWKRFPIYITDSLYLHKNYHKKIKKAIKKSELLELKEYKYSGLFFLLLPEMIESLTGEGFREYLQREIYDPIGATHLIYNPYLHYVKEKIIPTERDTFFRNQLVHGTVHDEAAAMLAGVSCNAGLFGNAESLAKLFQLYLKNGQHNGLQIIDSLAVMEFTRCLSISLKVCQPYRFNLCHS